MHRSGSTWVGRVLASAPEVFYVHEPLNPNFAPHYLQIDKIPYYWQITDGARQRLRGAFTSLLSGKFPRIDARFFRLERRFISRYPQALSFRWAGYRRQRFLLKDPFMLFNVEWFERCFGGATVLVTREPHAFIASLKAKNWRFDFTNWTSQPDLMDGPLAADRAAIEAAAGAAPDMIAQGCLLWRVLTREIHRLVQSDPHRILCSHEALCRDPLSSFRGMFDQLDLKWTSRTERMLRSNRRAAFDAPSPGASTVSSEGYESQWSSRLTAEEIERISSVCAEQTQAGFQPRRKAIIEGAPGSAD